MKKLKNFNLMIQKWHVLIGAHNQEVTAIRRLTSSDNFSVKPLINIATRRHHALSASRKNKIRQLMLKREGQILCFSTVLFYTDNLCLFKLYDTDIENRFLGS